MPKRSHQSTALQQEQENLSKLRRASFEKDRRPPLSLLLQNKTAIQKQKLSEADLEIREKIPSGTISRPSKAEKQI